MPRNGWSDRTPLPSIPQHCRCNGHPIMRRFFLGPCRTAVRNAGDESSSSARCEKSFYSRSRIGILTFIADGIRQFGDEVTRDLRELWRRMVFSLLASNYDDHLRNHGFLMHRPGRWSLSPAYDLNPVPEIDRARMNQTAIMEDGAEPSIAGALAAAPRFGLKTAEAKAILKEVFTAVSHWRQTGRRLRIKAAILNAYESAFENELMREAGKIAK